jgi:lipopolysaccharide/colanic/teichoic acid biosynthesis glycosyltransferase
MYSLFIKRWLDIIGGIAGLALSAPLFLVVVVLIRLFMGKPILFRQVRPGLNGQLFTCFKFRTMTEARVQNDRLLSDQERIAPLGKFLRRTSLDELPQLWNIVRGDLSFIGPRPLLKEYLPYYTPQESRRHAVRPGLTGWAQVHGRNLIHFDERLMLDVWYVDHLSWQLDLRILLATIRLVCTAKGTDPVSFPPLHEQRRLELNVAGRQGGHEQNQGQVVVK